MNETRKKHTVIKIILPVLVIVAAVLGLKMLSQLKPTPQRHEAPEQGLLVDVASLTPETHQVTVFATGNRITTTNRST